MKIQAFLASLIVFLCAVALYPIVRVYNRKKLPFRFYIDVVFKN